MVKKVIDATKPGYEAEIATSAAQFFEENPLPDSGTEVADVIMYSIMGVMHELTKIVGGQNVQSDLVKEKEGYKITIKWD